LFSNSNLDAFGNLAALKNWKFYQDAVFWIILVLLITYAVAMKMVRKNYKGYCVLKRFKSMKYEEDIKQIEARKVSF